MRKTGCTQRATFEFATNTRREGKKRGDIEGEKHGPDAAHKSGHFKSLLRPHGREHGKEGEAGKSPEERRGAEPARMTSGPNYQHIASSDKIEWDITITARGILCVSSARTLANTGHAKVSNERRRR